MGVDTGAYVVGFAFAAAERRNHKPNTTNPAMAIHTYVSDAPP